MVSKAVIRLGGCDGFVGLLRFYAFLFCIESDVSNVFLRYASVHL